jgi:hypothetical protein
MYAAMRNVIALLQLMLRKIVALTLYLLTWRIWWAPYNAIKGQMGFNSVFKGLVHIVTEIAVFHKL